METGRGWPGSQLPCDKCGGVPQAHTAPVSYTHLVFSGHHSGTTQLTIMLLHFYKMTGAGNDFVMVDNRDLELSSVLDLSLIHI